MSRIFFLLCAIWCASLLYGQEVIHSLPYYIEAAQTNSPLIQDCLNQKEIQKQELMRLKALYTRSILELNGDYLFVPIISKSKGKTTFEWNAKDDTDYYGYDLGESSGHLQAGITWTQPLLGNSSYKVAKERTGIEMNIMDNNIHLEKHQLERAMTEQYILCLLDKKQIELADSTGNILTQQENIVRKLVESGLVKQSDLHLLQIEQNANRDQRTTSCQSYRTHLIDLNILCGIKDTTCVSLENINLSPRFINSPGSGFLKQYQLDSLNTIMSLRSFNLQYKPQLNLFVDGGLRTGEYTAIQRHFGMSAGVTLSWILFDGKQKRMKERQTRAQLNSIETYKTNFQLQQELRKQQYLTELKTYEERNMLLLKRLSEYTRILSDYKKEIQAGQLSVIDYILILRDKIQAEQDRMLLQTNRQLLTAAFNYWNW